ncbi:cyclin-dependent kinase 2-interacting protein isoform X3 [Oryzias melastigma]|uniref:cyclin-dependent kinase 2-interacting protein isoform X3 n=1 Tax=Oryzias melastigma TaxID=30732 RepID=UPI000CF81D77|nr:cyclin-dependent kinase 2-interacting protein isoform X3 [Oryzias melastigma]
MIDLMEVTSSNRKCSAVTGSARKVRDNAADWHNLMLRWDRLTEEGVDVATSIVNTKRSQSESLLVPEASSSSFSSPSSSSSSSSTQPAPGAAELQERCLRLLDIVEKMTAIVAKMERLAASQEALRELEEFRSGSAGGAAPLFHSWSAKQFEDTSQLLLSAFTEELKLKQVIVQELAHTASFDLSMVYLSCWLHQPNIPPQSRLTLEALLLETGHRTL